MVDDVKEEKLTPAQRNAARVVDYLIDQCNSETVTFYTWIDLVNEVHGDTLIAIPRHGAEASQELNRHFKSVRKGLAVYGWGAVKLSFEPFRRYRVKSGAIIDADKFSEETWRAFLPGAHNRGVGLAVVGPHSGVHPILASQLSRQCKDARTRVAGATAAVNAAVERKQLPPPDAERLLRIEGTS